MDVVEDLVAACVQAMAETEPRSAVREAVSRAVADPRLAHTFGEPSAGFDILYRSGDLTVLNFTWPPHMRLFPHDHRMWAAIGIYRGREDNRFFRRGGGSIVPAGGKSLDERDVLLLGGDAIHAVENPVGTHTGAIHVYGGDFVAQPRSQWDPNTLVEEPFDLDLVRDEFARAERAPDTARAYDAEPPPTLPGTSAAGGARLVGARIRRSSERPGLRRAPTRGANARTPPSR